MRDGWHNRCVRRFFGTGKLPMLELTKERLEELANQAVTRGLTVPGVQKKLSLHLSQEERELRMTIVDYPAGFILKPPTEEYTGLPEYEDLTMRLARLAGVQTVEHALMRTEIGLAYVTRRIDRQTTAGVTKSYAMEDFCQLGGRLTQDKYRGSYEQCAKIIKRYSDTPGIDLSELYLRLVLSFVTGNSGMHLKIFH